MNASSFSQFEYWLFCLDLLDRCPQGMTPFDSLPEDHYLGRYFSDHVPSGWTSMRKLSSAAIPANLPNLFISRDRREVLTFAKLTLNQAQRLLEHEDTFKKVGDLRRSIHWSQHSPNLFGDDVASLLAGSCSLMTNKCGGGFFSVNLLEKSSAG